jgi:hypothetical protein
LSAYLPHHSRPRRPLDQLVTRGDLSPSTVALYCPSPDQLVRPSLPPPLRGHRPSNHQEPDAEKQARVATGPSPPGDQLVPLPRRTAPTAPRPATLHHRPTGCPGRGGNSWSRPPPILCSSTGRLRPSPGPSSRANWSQPATARPDSTRPTGVQPSDPVAAAPTGFDFTPPRGPPVPTGLNLATRATVPFPCGVLTASPVRPKPFPHSRGPTGTGDRP